MKDKIQLHPADATDAEAVWRLYEAARAAGCKAGCCDWPEDYPDCQFVQEDLAAGALFILRQNRCVVGAVSLLKHDDLDDLPGWTSERACVLARLCIAPELWRQGMGTAILTDVLQIAAARGYAYARLLSAINNPAAHRLYTHNGFVLRGTACLYGGEYEMFERRLEAR